MGFSFVAAREEDGVQVAIPFLCVDYYGRSSITMSAEVVAEVRAEIGDAFWSLVMSGDELADYRDRVFHPGACVWLDFGCSNGALYLNEEDE